MYGTVAFIIGKNPPITGFMKFKFVLAKDQQCLAHYTFKVIIGVLGLVCLSVVSDSVDGSPPGSSVHGLS